MKDRFLRKDRLLRQAQAASTNAKRGSAAVFAMTSVALAGSLYVAPKQAYSQSGCPPVPTGIAQHPTMLQSYAKRPPWEVAGVDYAVGVPSSTTLTDWQSLSGPGITVNTSSSPPYVRIDDTNGIVFSGVDFSLHGGAYIYLSNSSNATITNSKFGGANLTKILNGVINTDPNSQGLTVQYCTIDGAGSGAGATLISAAGGGTTTVLYNWLKNFPQHVIEFTQRSEVNYSIVYKYNLIEQGGMHLGAHLNYLQTYNLGSATSADVEYNTSYQTHQAGGGEGYQFENYNTPTSPGGTIANVTFAYNTMIATGGITGSAMSYMVHAGGYQNAGIGHDNYMDTTAAWGPLYPGSFSGWTLSHNYIMTTGAAFP